MKKILAFSLTLSLFACGGSHRSEAELVADCNQKKMVFDEDWNSGKEEKSKVEGDSILLLTEEILAEYPSAQGLPDVLYNAGEVSSNLAMFEKAIHYYSLFIEKFPKHEKVSYVMWLLGYQHEQLGKADKAIEVFQNLRKNYPDSPWAENARTKILELKDAQESAAQDAQNKKMLDSLDAAMK